MHWSKWTHVAQISTRGQLQLLFLGQQKPDASFPKGYHCYSLIVSFLSFFFFNPQMANLCRIPCPRTWFAFFYLFLGCGLAFSLLPFSFASLFLVMRCLGCWFSESIFQFATQRKRDWGIWDFNLFQLSLFLSYASSGPLGRNKSTL